MRDAPKNRKRNFVTWDILDRECKRVYGEDKNVCILIKEVEENGRTIFINLTELKTVEG